MPGAVCHSTQNTTLPSLPALAVDLNHLQERRRLARMEGREEDLAVLVLEILRLRHRMSYLRRRESILNQKKKAAQRPEVRSKRRAYLTSAQAREKRSAREKARYASDTRYANSKRLMAAARRISCPDKTKASIRKWRLAHPGYSAAYFKRRSGRDPAFKLSCLVRRRLAHAVAGTSKSACTEDLVGCSWLELRAHIESLFRPGMCWSNRELWHVDHKIPCKAFDLTDPEQQKQCFHWSNLQPLWKADNLSKGARQP